MTKPQIMFAAQKLSPGKGFGVFCRETHGLGARCVAAGRKVDLAVPEHVEHLGILGRCDLLATMRASTVVCCPSLWPESFGRIAVESMAVGTPVIATAYGGYVDQILEGETGWLIESNMPGALRRAIMVAIETVTPEMRARCREWARQRFGEQVVTSAHDALLAWQATRFLRERERRDTEQCE